VGVDDIQRAISDLKRMIRRDRPAHPLILFYYMGHGLGDPYSQTLYMVPGNLLLLETPTQISTLSLIKKTTTNLDLIFQLNVFRLPPVMAYLDSASLPDLMPDPRDPADFARSMAKANKLDAIDRDNRARGLYPNGTIPPVPYILMFDNCYGGVVPNLVSVPAQQQFLSSLAEIQSDALVLYAAAPGQAAGEFSDPSIRSDLPVGALARRLLAAIGGVDATRPTTLLKLRRALFAPKVTGPADKGSPFALDPPPPYSLSSGGADLIDLTLPHGAAGHGATQDRRLGTATQPVECCEP
jgi:hypothetical protein